MPNKSEGIRKLLCNAWYNCEYEELGIMQQKKVNDFLEDETDFIEAIRQAIKDEMPKYDYGMPKEKCCWCKGKGNEWIDAPDNLSGYDYRYPCRCRKKLKTKHNQILFTIHTALDKVFGGK